MFKCLKNLKKRLFYLYKEFVTETVVIKELRYVILHFENGRTCYRDWKFSYDQFKEYPVHEEWIIQRYKLHKKHLISWKTDICDCMIYGHEIDTHVLYGDPWPERMWNLFKARGLI